MDIDAQSRRQRFATARFAIEPSFSSYDRQRRTSLVPMQFTHFNHTTEIPGRLARKHSHNRQPEPVRSLVPIFTMVLVVIFAALLFRLAQITDLDIRKLLTLQAPFFSFSRPFPNTLQPAGRNLASDGASIIDAWTSLPVYKDSRTAAPSNLLKDVAGSNLSSWCFAGGIGQVGIALRNPGVLSHIGIRVIDHDRGYHWLKGLFWGTVLTAPREVIVWGLVDGSTSKKQIARLHGIPPPTALLNAGINPRYEFVPIARLEFDGRARTPIEQSMTINPIISVARVEFGLIVVEVRSNWGGALTCINRVMVHMEE